VLRGHYIGKDFFFKKNLHVSYDTYCVSREKHAFQKVKCPFVHEFGFLKCPFFCGCKNISKNLSTNYIMKCIVGHYV